MNEGAFRGIVLVAVAVVIGLILLGSGLNDTSSTARVDGGSASSSDDGGDNSSSDDGGTGDDTVGNPLSPSEINVLVANGAGVSGAAATVSATLTGLQYNVLPPVDTTVEASATPLDSVYYATSPNTQAQAEQVAQDLGLSASAVLPFDPATAPAQMGLSQVLVVLGSSANQLATTTAGGTTATTVPG